MTSEHFTLIQDRSVAEINSRARLYRHNQTGAQVLSLENNDENKVFGITFKTPPADSTGIAHIMEHTVLCGSRKYPVKEPFVELMKGSLNTFLNAFTYPDKTCYPVASQNVQDLYNLIDVYLDAVFYPSITPEKLQQEGWHYELDSADQTMAYKGVVFNEMKGAYSSPDNLLGRYTQQTLYPDNTYGVDSGGDPKHIPDLTYEQFMRFHQTCYHPSNALIYFYGDDDPAKRLEIVQGYLGDFSAKDANTAVALQPRFDAPRRLTVGYNAGDENSESQKRGLVSVNWMLFESGDVEASLAHHILSHILIGTPASPLRKALIDSGLGENLTGGGLDDELRQAMFTAGLKGINPDDAPKVEQLILDTLAQLARDGIDPNMVEAALNTIEFRMREMNTGGFPRGLAVMLSALSNWLYGGDPLLPLAYEAPLAAIKQHLAANPRYFEQLIQQSFLNNPHRTTVLLSPDTEAGKRDEAEERAKLDAAREAMNDDDILRVIEQTRKLKELQSAPDSPEALATIPMLKLTDLDKRNKLIPLEMAQMSGVNVLYHDLFTNGITYLDVGFNLRALPQVLLPYVALFGRALLEMGTESEDFVRLSQRIGRDTGGIRNAPFTSTVHHSGGEAAAWLFLRGKSTIPQTEKLLGILKDILLTPQLDNRERFRQLVLQEKASMESGLIPGGHRVVNTRLRARFSIADWAAEQMGGVSYLQFLRQLAEQVDSDWSAVLESLQDIRTRLLTRANAICNVTLDETAWKSVQPLLTPFLDSLPAGATTREVWAPPAPPAAEGLTLPAQVNYVGKGANLYDLGYHLNGSVLVTLNLLRNTWLWERVRVQGGAYGGFCLFDQRSGAFTYLSYRDPNLLTTLDNYDNSAAFLRDVELSEDEVVKSIIGTIGDFDAYQLPDAKGFTSLQRYLANDTDADRQRLRDEVLSTDADDIRAFADMADLVRQHGAVVVLGAESAIRAANTERQLGMQITRAM